MVNKLELTWYGKDEPIVIEPRLLIENAAISNCAADPDTQNMLIHGDNLLALKALESKYAGQVKCTYIDPPYNVNAVAGQYNDNIEHSQWLNLMRPRLDLLRSNDGSIWISIDDEECHYLKVLCDEVFGRKNFIASVIWRKNYAPKSSARHLSGEDKLNDHDVVAKKKRGVQYCIVASRWGKANGYKEWRYLFIPSKQVTPTSSFIQLAKRFVDTSEV